MINVLGFTRGTGLLDVDGPQYYRALLPLREVHKAANGIATQLLSSEDVIGLSDRVLEDVDFVTMSRMYQEDIDPFLLLLHTYGAQLVLDADDDLTENYKLVSGRGEIFKEILGKVDHVTVSTQPLADLYGQYTSKPPVVLRNHVDVDWMIEIASRARRLQEGLTIGVTGSPTHWGDWRIVAPPLQRIVKEFRPGLTPILSGEVPRYMKYVGEEDERIELGGVPFSVYPVILKQFDIVLCAVDTQDPFNDGKSAVKALECMALGVVPICSRFGPYMDLATGGAPVIIVEEDTGDGWFEAMRKVVQDDDYRTSLSKRGPTWVKEHRDMQASGHLCWSNFYKGA